MASPPRNGVYIVQGEMSLVVSALRKNARWGTHNLQDEDQDPLLHSFAQLKDILASVTDISEVDVNVFLLPFLNVIRSEDTTGPITGVALSSVNKFLSYGLIDPSKESAASGIENLADAVTHARFVGTDPSSDEVVLMKILQVLRTLLLTPVGAHMTNESVCEIMQSCFRICFEMRLSELLRRSAEQTLMDMVQLLFSRLPQFKEEARTGVIANIRKVFKRAGAIATGKRTKKHSSPKPQRAMPPQSTLPEKQEHSSDQELACETSTQDASESELTGQESLESLKSLKDSTHEPSETCEERLVESGHHEQGMLPLKVQELTGSTDSIDTVSEEEGPVDAVSIATHVISCEESASKVERGDDITAEKTQPVDSVASHVMESPDSEISSDIDHNMSVNTEEGEEVMEHGPDTDIQSGDFVNPRGVRFTPQEPHKEGNGPLIPYGLPCVRELFRFLISLISPSDRHNSDTMIHMGLSLLTVAFESGASHIDKFASLMNLVKDEMCRNLFLLLQCDVHGLFAMALRVSFLVLESLRSHLKFQMELFFRKVMDILAMDVQSVPYWKRELILDCINQLFRVPHLVTELYINYDCDLYCKDLFDELAKLLSKNAFPAGGLCTVNLLALDALLGVVNTIESHCHPETSKDERKVETEDTVEGTEKKKEKSGDDSGTDEHCEVPPLSPPPPPTSGYAMASQMVVGVVSEDQSVVEQDSERNGDSECSDDSRTLWNTSGHITTLPTQKELAQIKQKKKLLRVGTEQFNIKPKKGLEFLQEHGLLSTPMDPEEVAIFLRENHDLDKKMIGDYIGEKKNPRVLESFVRSFHFKDVRLDEALRQFLETFRLPGESPVIEHIMEYFTGVFYELMREPFVNKDAAFTLAYAVIMLNVDQHNTNIKQQKPMTVEQFKHNLRKTNGNGDFPAEYLEKIYNAIRGEEIVMPAERTGKVKENYEWKVLLKRSLTPEARFIPCHGSSFDKDLFLIIWGPTVAALSYVYDNGVEKSVVQKALGGFRKSALISAHYGLSDVFDNLVISLCKFTTLLTTQDPGENLPILFGGNLKAQYSARTMFALAHRHGDILREGWKNILDCMLQLYKAKLLPKTMVEVEDFVDPSGRISLIREEIPLARPDSIFSSWYQYIMLNPEPANGRGQSVEDRQAQEQAQSVVKDCHPELLITESKFLRPESLNELIKALVFASSGPDTHESLGTQYEEEAAVFFLEILIRVVLQNRDRVSLLWHTVRDHITNIIISANQHSFLVERAVVGLLRLASRLLRKEDISTQVLLSLRIFLMMKFAVLQKCCRQISFGLHDILRTNASSITSLHDWDTIFTLIECVGAAVSAPTITPGPSLSSIAKDSEGSGEPDFDMMEGYSADSETASIASVETENSSNNGPLGETWLVISKEDSTGMNINPYDLKLNEKINKHDSKSFVKSCQTMAFLIRDGAHVSTENFQQCIHTVRIFAEASVNGGAGCRMNEHSNNSKVTVDRKGSWGKSSKKKYEKAKRSQSPTMSKSKKFGRPSSPTSSDSDEAEIYETINNSYDAMSLQLIELMHTLHTQAFSLYGGKKSEIETTLEENGDEMSFLWVKCWCPLLQGIARLCCDVRREVRMSALTYLQRALLVQDLQSLTAVEWESCFNKVLFPMLSRLLEVSSTQDPIALEETRMRAATLLCKVFLQHLNPLLSLTTFTALWLTILDFMDKYMHADDSDLLLEAIPESLKNMLLVMSTAGIFHEESCNVDSVPSQSHNHPDVEAHKYSVLWQVTWERIDCFLPKLKHELFLSRAQPSSRPSSPAVPSPEPVVTEMVRSAEQTPVKSEDKQSPVSIASNSVTQSPPANQVCVILQPPLPSLSGSRSSSPNLQTSLSDPSSLSRPTSVPIILAPSPSSKPGTPSSTHANTPTEPDAKEISGDCAIEIDDVGSVEQQDNTEKAAQDSPTKPAFSIYDI